MTNDWCNGNKNETGKSNIVKKWMKRDEKERSQLDLMTRSDRETTWLAKQDKPINSLPNGCNERGNGRILPQKVRATKMTQTKGENNIKWSAQHEHARLIF